MVDYTPILRLVQPDFDQTPWDEDVNNNFAVLDAAYGKFIGIGGLTGAWQNATEYVIGQSAVDTANSTLWTCAVTHTSATSPTTFAQERVAHPSYWTSAGAVLVYLPITGGTLTGNLSITPPTGSAQLTLSGSAGAGLQIAGTVGTSARWLMQLGDGSAGQHFALNRYSDTATYLGTPMAIDRASGTITLSGLTKADNITSNNTFGLTASGAYFSSTATSTYLVQDSLLWRWEYTRANGRMDYVRGSDSTSLFNIDGSGNIGCPGTAFSHSLSSTSATISGVANINVVQVNGSGFQFSTDGTLHYSAHAPGWYEGFAISGGTRTWVNSDTTVMSLASNGDLTLQAGTGYKTGGGAWAAISDARIKDVLGDYTTGLDAILSLRPVHYRYKTSGQEHIGLVAQEAEIVMPEMVTQGSGEIDGKLVDDLRTLDMTALPLAIVNAIKELYARVVALEAKV